MAGRIALAVFGVVTSAFWLSKAVFPTPVPPVVPFPDLSPLVEKIAGVSPEIRARVPSLAEPDGVIAENLRRGIFIWTIEMWASIAAGTLAGVLVSARRSAGRWLALGLGVFLLVPAVGGHLDLAIRLGVRDYLAAMDFMLRRAPNVMLNLVLDVSFSTFTIWFLLRRTTIEAFRGRGEPPPRVVAS